MVHHINYIIIPFIVVILPILPMGGHQKRPKLRPLVPHSPAWTPGTSAPRPRAGPVGRGDGTSIQRPASAGECRRCTTRRTYGNRREIDRKSSRSLWETWGNLWEIYGNLGRWGPVRPQATSLVGLLLYSLWLYIYTYIYRYIYLIDRLCVWLECTVFICVLVCRPNSRSTRNTRTRWSCCIVHPPVSFSTIFHQRLDILLFHQGLQFSMLNHSPSSSD